MDSPIKSNTSFMSDDIRELAKAFSLAKKEFKATGLEGNNHHLKTKYPKLGGIFHAVEDALDKHDITLFQFKRAYDTGIEYMHTQIFHRTTGQFIEDLRIVESEKPGNQGKGAADTYVKKAAILTICCIVAGEEEDDDGQSEQEHIKQKGFLTKEDIADIINDLKSTGKGRKLHDEILAMFKVNNLDQLPYNSFETIKKYIKNNG